MLIFKFKLATWKFIINCSPVEPQDNFFYFYKDVRLLFLYAKNVHISLYVYMFYLKFYIRIQCTCVSYNSDDLIKYQIQVVLKIAN